MRIKYLIKSVLFGLSIGDAVGVPFEFKSREEMKQQPATDMVGYGTHYQPIGTFSDDTSMAFCIVESIINGFSLDSVSDNFIKWMDNGFWTTNGHLFDIGNMTVESLTLLKNGHPPKSHDKNNNGNGSLMRCAPLVFTCIDETIDNRFKIIKEVSSLTHNHIYSIISCFYYTELLRVLLTCRDKFESYHTTNQIVSSFIEKNGIVIDGVLDNILSGNIHVFDENNIRSHGYVIDTLEAAVWTLLNTSSYKDSILTAVNLGEDTDTTATVVGGLAGVLYGYNTFPTEWMSKLKRKTDIDDLVDRLIVNKFMNYFH